MNECTLFPPPPIKTGRYRKYIMTFPQEDICTPINSSLMIKHVIGVFLEEYSHEASVLYCFQVVTWLHMHTFMITFDNLRFGLVSFICNIFRSRAHTQIITHVHKHEHTLAYVFSLHLLLYICLVPSTMGIPSVQQRVNKYTLISLHVCLYLPRLLIYLHLPHYI